MKKLVYYLIVGVLFLGAGSPILAQSGEGPQMEEENYEELMEEVELSFLKYSEKSKYSYHNGRHLRAEHGRKLAIVRVKSVNEEEMIPLKKDNVRLKSKSGEEAGLRGGQSFKGEYRSELPEIVKGLCYIDLVFSIPADEEPSEVIILGQSVLLEKK